MREIVAADVDAAGTVWAVSTDVPGDGESHRAGNRLHAFESGAGRVVADWVGWQVTDLAAFGGTIVCTSVRQHLYRYRAGDLSIVEHPERDRCLHCCTTTPAGLFIGGSAGYLLTSATADLNLVVHNLRDYGLAKPGRDIHTIQPYGDGLLVCGAGRLVATLQADHGTLLLPPGPTAATPTFHAAAAVDDRIAVASWQRLWWLLGDGLVPMEVAPEVHIAAGALAVFDDRLFVGGNAVFSGSLDGRFECRYRHPNPEAWVVDFLPAPIRVVWSTGDVIEMAGSPRGLGNILGEPPRGLTRS